MATTDAFLSPQVFACNTLDLNFQGKKFPALLDTKLMLNMYSLSIYC